MAFGDVDITEGAGTPIAMDLIGGRNFQRGKLVSGREGVTDAIGDDDKGSSLRALWVAEKSDLVIPTTPVNSSGLTTASTSYSVGDVLGAGWTIPNAVRASGETGRIETISLVDVADVTDGIHLWIAQESLTFGTDNAGPSISDADASKLLGRLTVAMIDLGGCRVGALDSINFPYVCNGSTNLYIYAVTATAHSFFGAATDLKIRVGLVRN